MTLSKKGLKTGPYNIDMEKMEKKDLKKRKGQLIKLLLKQKKSKKVCNHDYLLDNGPFKDEVEQFNKPLVMTKDDEQHFITMNGCHICGEKYNEKDVGIRDHCHITGKFRGSAHQECNLKLKIKPENIKVPVIFHNLLGYDSHFIMQLIKEIAKKHAYTNKKGEKQDLNINAIPNNMEKYMAFMLGNHLTFIDSFQFEF